MRLTGLKDCRDIAEEDKNGATVEGQVQVRQNGTLPSPRALQRRASTTTTVRPNHRHVSPGTKEPQSENTGPTHGSHGACCTDTGEATTWRPSRGKNMAAIVAAQRQESSRGAISVGPESGG